MRRGSREPFFCRLDLGTEPSHTAFLPARPPWGEDRGVPGEIRTAS